MERVGRASRVFRVPRQRSALSGLVWPGKNPFPAKPSPAPLRAVQGPFSPTISGLEQRAWNRQTAQPATPPDDLEQRSDEQLQALIVRASGILEAREKERKRQALDEIRQLAKAHGLTVSLSEAPAKKKRGRPRKPPPPG